MKIPLFVCLLLLAIPDYAQTIAGKPLAYYMNERKIPLFVKEVYAGKKQPSDDEQTMGMLDSLVTNNVLTRPFYFVTITKTLRKADGAYAEALGITAKDFVLRYPRFFVSYFNMKSNSMQQDFKQWSGLIAGELLIENENAAVATGEKYGRLLNNNCNKCTASQRRKLTAFSQSIISDMKRLSKL